ncbi:MAG: hypothetical protein PVI30_16365 [Myxococcales bacterium]
MQSCRQDAVSCVQGAAGPADVQACGEAFAACVGIDTSALPSLSGPPANLPEPPDLGGGLSSPPATGCLEQLRSCVLGGGSPPAPEMPAGAGANTGPCDQPSTAPGCDDPTITDCVCAQDGGQICCAEAWDAICVGLVQGFECTGDCYRATGALGCADPQVESGVCAVSPGCCDAGWDEFCTVVAEANGACQ